MRQENFIHFRGVHAGLEGEFIRPQCRGPTAHEIERAVNTGIRCAGSVSKTFSRELGVND